MNDKKQPIEYILHSIVDRQLKLLKINRDWRVGQALFNALHDLYPSIANKIKGTENDPFYDDKKIPDCFISIINIYKENEEIKGESEFYDTVGKDTMWRVVKEDKDTVEFIEVSVKDCRKLAIKKLSNKEKQDRY